MDIWFQRLSRFTFVVLPLLPFERIYQWQMSLNTLQGTQNGTTSDNSIYWILQCLQSHFFLVAHDVEYVLSRIQIKWMKTVSFSLKSVFLISYLLVYLLLLRSVSFLKMNHSVNYGSTLLQKPHGKGVLTRTAKILVYIMTVMSYIKRKLH